MQRKSVNVIRVAKWFEGIIPRFYCLKNACTAQALKNDHEMHNPTNAGMFLAYFFSVYMLIHTHW